jgi:formamidopyrimidine-DNA glycosylase
MFELPEYLTIAAQMKKTLAGKRIKEGSLGNSPHKFVWYNRSPEEFAALTKGKTVGEAYARGRWLFVPLEPGYVLVFGECGGKILFHVRACDVPPKYHLLAVFEDGTALSATTQMWGAMELYEKGRESERKYIREMRPTPVDEAFTRAYFASLVEECLRGEKRSVKGLLTQDQLIPGLGNSIAQDIMFKARLNPKRSLEELDAKRLKALYDAIIGTVKEAVRSGGRNDEVDLFEKPGGYARVMDKNSPEHPCPECGMEITKIQYLGGACYFCPACQPS